MSSDTFFDRQTPLKHKDKSVLLTNCLMWHTDLVYKESYLQSSYFISKSLYLYCIVKTKTQSPSLLLHIRTTFNYTVVF